MKTRGWSVLLLAAAMACGGGDHGQSSNDPASLSNTSGTAGTTDTADKGLGSGASLTDTSGTGGTAQGTDTSAGVSPDMGTPARTETSGTGEAGGTT